MSDEPAPLWQSEVAELDRPVDDLVDTVARLFGDDPLYPHVRDLVMKGEARLDLAPPRRWHLDLTPMFVEAALSNRTLVVHYSRMEDATRQMNEALAHFAKALDVPRWVITGDPEDYKAWKAEQDRISAVWRRQARIRRSRQRR